MNGIVAPADHRQWPSENRSMPLLRSLAGRAARVAINMALLTELFASTAHAPACLTAFRWLLKVRQSDNETRNEFHVSRLLPGYHGIVSM